MTGPKWLWLWLGVLLLLEGCRWCCTNACWEDERIALLQLKPFFNNSYNHLNSWVEEAKDSDCCEWEGVECDTSSSSRRVIGLSLNYTTNGYWDLPRRVKYSWYLNASLFLPFKELKRLYLSRNNITGFVENEDFAKLSLALGNLEILDLSGNYLNDTILLSLSQFSSLKHLYLAGNFFTGSSHANGFQLLSRLNSLETLDLRENFLKNGILFQMGNLSSLKTLNLGSNSLEGAVYIHDLNTLSNLKNLDLSNNGIKSLQPSNQGNKTQLRLINLEVLNLNDNRLRNNTFSLLRGLSSLKCLSMHYNRLQGSLHIKDLDAFTNLEELDLSFNDLNGFLAHKEFKSLGMLEVLRLTNVFTEESISLLKLVEAFPSVKTFYLENNYLNKTMATQELHVRSNVEEIFLDGSYLNNNILQNIGVLTSLKTLSLSRCGFTGALPNQGWCDIKNLEQLDISENAFEGVLPYCLGNLTSLRVLDFSNNKFTGNLTPLTNLTSLRFVSLSRNRFQISMSFIPFANLPNLKILLVDENKMVMEQDSFHTSIPKFQINFISLSKCTADQELNLKPPKLFYYQYDLRYVDLSYNNFSGTIPFWLFENNTKLEDLYLMGNSLRGPLLLPQLLNHNAYSIDISSNILQGQIPKNICSTFPNLEWLFLSNNAFEGNIPPCLGGMAALFYLDLSNNQLSGRVPEELFMRSSLDILRLSNNYLSGKLAPTTFNLSMLSGLFLDGNNFAGEIPDIDIPSADFLYSLEDINLSNNNLHGKIPRWIGNVSSLERLALSNNQFEGSIPKELCNLIELELLELSQNNLTGSVPSCFNQKYLTHVHLKGNKLSGQLPHAFYNSSTLVTLDLRENNLTGNIPEWIDTLSALSVLLLKANHLDGGIPIQLCKLYSLSILDLSENMFFGPIPSCLGNLTLAPDSRKSYLDAGNYIVYTREEESTFIGTMTLVNDIFRFYPDNYVEELVDFTTKNGFYSYGGDILDYMSGIDLSCNKLIGRIPEELGNLSEIHSLNISHNNLIGVIPSSFSKLKNIESLDLSYNNLSGRIPIQLVDLNTLEVFSVAHNNLSGGTPERKAQFGTFDASSYEGNPFLCGPPLHKNCSENKSPSIIPTKSDDEGEGSFIDTSVFCVTFLVSYVIVLLGIFVVLYINPYWRQAWFSFIEGCITTCR